MGDNTLLIIAGLGLGALILTQSAGAKPGCTDTTWTCSTTDRLEHSNCGNTRTTTPCSLASDASEMIAGTMPIDLRYDVNDNGIVDSEDVTLLMGGTPLRALHLANITCTAGTASSTGEDKIVINFTWTNTGEVTGSFVPSVIVDKGATTDLGIGTISIAPGATYNTEKTLSGITSGTHTVCPNPN